MMAEKPANDPVACEKVIAELLKNGGIRRRPEPNRVDIDDAAWLVLDAEVKKAMLATLGCAAFGGKAPRQYTHGEYTVAYGARSGKKLAQMSEYGMKFE
jgi:hypothetical protein